MTQPTPAIQTGPAAKWPRVLAGAIAACVLGAALVAAGRRSIADVTLVFSDAPKQIVPEGHNRQVEIVRRTVRPGSTLFYVMDKDEAWQLGLWQRSLYPDYLVVPVTAPVLKSEMYRRIRERDHIEYAISAGNPPPAPGFLSTTDLPPYATGIPVVLGTLPPP